VETGSLAMNQLIFNHLTHKGEYNEYKRKTGIVVEIPIPVGSGNRHFSTH
jgi:hypothetical protein